MKTIHQLEQENADLRRMNDKLKNEILKALETVADLMRAKQIKEEKAS